MVKTYSAGDVGSVPDGGTKSHMSKKPNRKQKQKYNKFNKDFKTGPHQKKKKKALKKSLVKKKSPLQNPLIPDALLPTKLPKIVLLFLSKTPIFLSRRANF